MVALTHPYEVRLAARGLYQIDDVAGVRVTCTRGTVWITIDDDQRDIILEPGETFIGSAHRRALVSAFGASELRVGAVHGENACPPAPAWAVPA